jgi:hypothetical protein
MSQIINAVREVMQDSQQMNINEILKKLSKGAYQMRLKKEDLVDVFQYYSKLQVVYVDSDENVLFL